MSNTFIRQCAWCKKVWDESSHSWIFCDHVIPVATHTMCDKCRIDVRKDIQDESK